MFSKSFKKLTICSVLYISAPPALAQNRCVADLQRVQLQNCLSQEKQQLTYNWRLTDSVFDIQANTCLSDASADGTHRDIIIGIDRSSSNMIPDRLRKKLRADGLSVSTDLINSLNEKYQSNIQQAPSLSLTLFSSQTTCREYTGGKVAYVGEFPCLYVKSGKVTDELHRKLLLELITESEGKYSAGSTDSASKLEILPALIRDGIVLSNTGRQSSVVMFTTGLSYAGAVSDTFAFLKSANYETAENTASTAFALDAVRKHRLLLISAPLPTPIFAGEYRDSFENMCGLPDRPATDCAAKSIEPATWLVNKLDLKRSLSGIASISGGAVIESSAADIANKISLQLMVNGQKSIVPEKVILLVNGQQSDAVTLSGEQIVVQGLAAGVAQDIRLEVYASGVMVPFSLAISTETIEGASADFVENEMFCKAETLDPEIVDPKITLKDLQGGSGSCGVIGNRDFSGPLNLIVLMLPLLLLVRSSRCGKNILLAVLSILVFQSRDSFAEGKPSGLNSQHYRPVVDGIGNSESGRNINSGSYTAGLYGDYANDPVEIGGEKGKRIRGVTDDMVTAHFVGNLGLFSRMSIGFHVPYVHKTDIEREVEGEEVEGGTLGQPADSAVFAKIGLLTKPSWAMSLIPLVTVPTGNSEYLLGDGTASYGGSFALSGKSGGFLWATNMGYMYREKALVLEDDRTNQLKITGYGLISSGAEYRVNGIFSVGGNVSGKFHSGEKIDFSKTNPAEWQAISKMKVTGTLETSLGFGTGIGKGYGSPDYRVIAGLSYIPVTAKGAVRRVAGPAKNK